MKSLLALSITLFGSVVASERDSAAVELRFAPAEGLVLKKTFTTVSDSESDMSSERGSGSTSSTNEMTLVAVDEYASDEERVTQLVRRYEEASGKSESSGQFGDREFDASSTSTTELEGATVTFTWDEDDEQYRAASDEVDADVLAELPFDLDFTRLLPEGPVEEGDTWSLGPETYRELMDPYAGVPWDVEASDGRNFAAADRDESEEPEEEEDGELRVTFAGLRTVDGVELAVLELEGEIETERSFSHQRDFDGGSVDTTTDTTEERAIRGEALWDAAAGHLVSFEAEVEVHGTSSTEGVVHVGEEEHDQSSTREYGNSIRFTASFEPAE